MLFQRFEVFRSLVIRNFIHLFVWDLEGRADAPVCRETSTGAERNERAGGAGCGRTQERKASKNKAPEIQTADRYLYIATKMRNYDKCPQITVSLLSWDNYNFYRKEWEVEGKIQAIRSHKCMTMNSRNKFVMGRSEILSYWSLELLFA